MMRASEGLIFPRFLAKAEAAWMPQPPLIESRVTPILDNRSMFWRLLIAHARQSPVAVTTTASEGPRQQHRTCRELPRNSFNFTPASRRHN